MRGFSSRHLGTHPSSELFNLNYSRMVQWFAVENIASVLSADLVATRSHEYHGGGLLPASSVGGGFLMLCMGFTLVSIMVMIIFACGDSSNGSRRRSSGGVWGGDAMYGAGAAGSGCGVNGLWGGGAMYGAGAAGSGCGVNGGGGGGCGGGGGGGGCGGGGSGGGC